MQTTLIISALGIIANYILLFSMKIENAEDSMAQSIGFFVSVVPWLLVILFIYDWARGKFGGEDD